MSDKQPEPGIMDMDERIESQLRSHYSSLQLRPEKLEALRAMADGSASAADSEAGVNYANRGQSWFWQSSFALAAALMLVVFAFQFSSSAGISSEDLAQLVSKEIALNHNKRLLPEFEATDYATLGAQLDKLDFVPLQSVRILPADLHLVGARYCSIHGQLAAQIKLQGDNGEFYTLYQTQLNKELSELPEADYRIDGVFVQQWQERGVFFGLARTAQ